jgi:hypothetical protein
VKHLPFLHAKFSNKLHLVPWAQSLYAAALQLGITVDEINESSPDLLVSVQKSVDDEVWVSVPRGGIIGPDDFVRVCARPVVQNDHHHQGDMFEEGRTCWHLPMGTQRDIALQGWTPELKAAVYATLRSRGNHFRNIGVQKFLASQFLQQPVEAVAAANATNGARDELDDAHAYARKLPRLAVWASTLSGSCLQPYWHLTDASLARWLARVRFDQCPTEDFWRSEFRPGQDGTGRGLPRINDRHRRACYLCAAIAGSTDVHWPETLVHVFLTCSHPEITACRTRFAAALVKFATTLDVATSTSGLRQPPDFTDPTVAFTILQLCTGLGPVGGSPILQQQVPVASTDPEVLRRSPQFVRDVHQARRTVEWMEPFFRRWLDIARSSRCADRPYQSAGHRLAVLVGKHVRNVFAVRSRALADAAVDSSFRRRSRDTAAARAARDSSRAANNINNQSRQLNTLADLSDAAGNNVNRQQPGSVPVVLQNVVSSTVPVRNNSGLPSDSFRRPSSGNRPTNEQLLSAAVACVVNVELSIPNPTRPD